MTTAEVKQTSNGTAAHVDDVLQLVSFRLEDEEYGIEILRVQEIIRRQELTRVPNAPQYVEGVINLRGKVIPVIALRKRFGLPGRDQDKHTRIVVSEVGGTVVGFEVDAVSEVLRIRRVTIEPPPWVSRVDRDFIGGVGKLEGRLLILLNLESFLAHFKFQSAARDASHAEIPLPEPESVPA